MRTETATCSGRVPRYLFRPTAREESPEWSCPREQRRGRRILRAERSRQQFALLPSRLDAGVVVDRQTRKHLLSGKLSNHTPLPDSPARLEADRQAGRAMNVERPARLPRLVTRQRE